MVASRAGGGRGRLAPRPRTFRQPRTLRSGSAGRPCSKTIVINMALHESEKVGEFCVNVGARVLCATSFIVCNRHEKKKWGR